MPKRGHALYLLLGLALLLTACDDGDDAERRYDVTLVNLTADQPLTPAAVVLHRDGYTPWRVGEPAGDGLERLAESGVPDAFLEAAGASRSVLATASGTGPVPPGGRETIELTVDARDDLRLSLASMLAATNDGFVGTADRAVGQLDPGASMRTFLHIYDAGTEANSESRATVPALGGEGYSPDRDDLADFVAVHPGVVSTADGLPSSALGEGRRFLSPAAMLMVTRQP